MHVSKDRVTGMKKFKGEIEGKSYDSTTVYVETRLHDAQGNRRGNCTIDFNAGTSEVFDRFRHIDLPADFEIEWDTITNGKKIQQIIVDMRPLKTEVKNN